MFAGLFTYLADDDDTVRLAGTPLFTISDGAEKLLYEDTENGTTWPQESPAGLQASAAGERIRWQAVFFGDRIMIRMEPGWTRIARPSFTIPGRWVSPKGAPRWRSILKAAGPPTGLASSGTLQAKVSAAELAFPGGDWDLCFEFSPAQEVAFDGAAMNFSLGSSDNENWTVGFCRPGALQGWRWPHG